jgi:glycerol uptake facilitator-like aquaporin
MAMIYALGPLSGLHINPAVMNPARTLGPDIVGWNFTG